MNGRESYNKKKVSRELKECFSQNEGARAAENLHKSRSSFGVFVCNLDGVDSPTGQPLRFAIVLLVVLDCFWSFIELRHW